MGFIQDIILYRDLSRFLRQKPDSVTYYKYGTIFDRYSLKAPNTANLVLNAHRVNSRKNADVYMSDVCCSGKNIEVSKCTAKRIYDLMRQTYEENFYNTK